MIRDLTITIDVSGLTGAIDAGTRDGLALGANIVVNAAKESAPVQTGELRSSIQVTSPPEGNISTGDVSATIGAGAGHAIFVELGTGIHGPSGQQIWIEPVNRKALRFPAPGGGGFLFSKGHFVDGMMAQPFLVPALEDNADRIAQAVGDGIENAIDALGD